MRRAAFVLILLAPRLAAADPNRVALGTADPNLKSALYVRGLDVVETPEPLLASSALELARMRADAMNVDAVVWLCDLGADGRGLCLYDRKTDSLYVRHVPLAQPLSSSDAAGVALSVKYFLAPKSTPPPAEAAQLSDTELPHNDIDRLQSEQSRADTPYAWTLEVAGGSRMWNVGPESAGARVGLEATWSPNWRDRHFGVGMGVSAGPSVSASEDSTNTTGDRMHDDHLSDVTLSFFARGRIRLAPTWLELDLGPSVHFLSLEEHHDAYMPYYGFQDLLHHPATDVSLDARVGVVFPLRSLYLAVRGGGFYMVDNNSLGMRPLATGTLVPWTPPAAGLDIGLSLGFGIR